MSSALTQSDVEARIRGLDEESARRVVCALVGHSRIQTHCFGYYYCARCGEQVGDTLGSVYDGARLAVVVGHDCNLCRENAKALTWRDSMLSPEPFAPADPHDQKAEVHPHSEQEVRP